MFCTSGSMILEPCHGWCVIAEETVGHEDGMLVLRNVLGPEHSRVDLCHVAVTRWLHGGGKLEPPATGNCVGVRPDG